MEPMETLSTTNAHSHVLEDNFEIMQPNNAPTPVQKELMRTIQPGDVYKSAHKAHSLKKSTIHAFYIAQIIPLAILGPMFAKIIVLTTGDILQIIPHGFALRDVLKIQITTQIHNLNNVLFYVQKENLQIQLPKDV